MNEQQKFNKEVTYNIRRLRKRIGENIHAVRRLNKIPLENLARLSYLSADSIDRLEIGKGEINLLHIVKLSLALKVETDLLLDTKTTESHGKEQ